MNEPYIRPADICVCCGDPVPEGDMLCWRCGRKIMNELKPCPFCGGKAMYHEKPISMIQCKACLADIRGAKFRLPPVNYPEYLASLWNRRANNGNG